MLLCKQQHMAKFWKEERNPPETAPEQNESSVCLPRKWVEKSQMTSFESHRLYDFMVCHLDHYPGHFIRLFLLPSVCVCVIPPTGLFPIAYISYVDFLCLIPSTQTVKHWGAWINPFDGRTHAAFQIYYLPPRVHDLHEHPGRVQINSSDVKLRKKAKWKKNPWSKS